MKKQEDILIGKRIKDIRSSLKMSQKSFAEKINATVSALSNWENGRNKPNDIMLREIALLGNTTVTQILTGIDESNTLYNIGKNVYIDLLDEYNEENEIGKALRFFTDKEISDVILSATKVIANIEGTSKLADSITDKRSLAYLSIRARIKKAFYEKYYLSVKNNQNLIALISNQISDLIYKADTYDYISDYGRHTSLNDIEGLFILGTSDLGINISLRNDIEKILLACQNEIDDLKDIYPNEESSILHRIYFFDHDDRSTTDEYTSTLYIDDSGNIDEHSEVHDDLKPIFKKISDMLLSDSYTIDEILEKLK